MGNEVGQRIHTPSGVVDVHKVSKVVAAKDAMERHARRCQFGCDLGPRAVCPTGAQLLTVWTDALDAAGLLPGGLQWSRNEGMSGSYGRGW